jgi:hypothetical protein
MSTVTIHYVYLSDRSGWKVKQPAVLLLEDEHMLIYRVFEDVLSWRHPIVMTVPSLQGRTNVCAGLRRTA